MVATRRTSVVRARGVSVRLRLTLSYAGLVMVTGVVLLAVVWVFLLRYVPDRPIDTSGGFVPNRADLLQVFVPAAATVLGALLLFGIGSGWWLAGRVLSPLAHITEATRQAANGSLTHRIRLPGRRDEFRELADSFDGMLSQLEAQVASQERFAANASHELRTPLAITQSLLDVARRDPALNAEQLVAQLHAVNSRAIDLTEALLMLSRADQGSFAREAVDVSLLAEQAAETLLPLASARQIEIGVSGDVAVAAGSPALLLQLVTNLVHNGIVHNVSEPGRGSVWVHTRLRAGAVILVVENTGPDVSPELVATLVEPFQRGVARIRDHHAGVGLGLAIVDAIVRAHAGMLDIAPRNDGGLVVTVELPAQADRAALQRGTAEVR